MPKVVKIVYYCVPYLKTIFLFQKKCQMHRETTIIDIAIAKECENIPFI